MAANVLISSAGRRVALLNIFRRVLRELDEGRVLTADASAYSAAAWSADRMFTVPACTDPDFIPIMLDLCERERVSLLIPTIDTELAAYAAHQEEFRRAGTLVAISGVDTITIAAQKRNTHDFLVANGFPTVGQAEVDEVRRDPRRWPLPLIVKPVNGSASKGVHLVRTPAEFELATRRTDVVVQRVAPGTEFTSDVFVDEAGCCRCVVPRERIEVRSGEVMKARTARVEPLIALMEKLTASLPQAFGVLNIQTFYDRESGQTSVIEINPRFGGGFPLSDRAGAPFARWLVQLALGQEVTYAAPAWRPDLVMLRYDEGVFVDQAGIDQPCAP